MWHHGAGEDVVEAPSQLSLGVQMCHQRAGCHKFRNVQRIVVAVFFQCHLLDLEEDDGVGGHGVVLDEPQEVNS